jgi:diacylglycerol kinase family enzyme
MPSIGLIANPHSRRNRKNPAAMRAMLRYLGRDDEYVETGSADEVARVAVRFRKRGIDVLGLNGGDGTLHHTLTEFIRVYGNHPLPSIALLRGGTMNTVANSCGVRRGTPAELIKALVGARRKGLPLAGVLRDIMRIDDRYGFIFGNGMVYEFIAQYYSYGDPSVWSAFRTLLEGCASIAVGGAVSRRMFRRFRAKVIVDGAMWPYPDYVSVVGSTISQVGLGFRPFVRHEERPHSFHLLGLYTTAAGFALELPAIRLARPLNSNKIIDAVAERAVFEADEPIKYMVDGDRHEGAKRLELGVGPRLKILLLR